MAFYSPFSWDKKGKGSFTIYFVFEFNINEYSSLCETFPRRCSIALQNPKPHNRWKCWVTSPLVSQQRTPVKSWTTLRCKKNHKKIHWQISPESWLYFDINLKPGKLKFKHPWMIALIGSAEIECILGSTTVEQNNQYHLDEGRLECLRGWSSRKL